MRGSVCLLGREGRSVSMFGEETGKLRRIKCFESFEERDVNIK